MATAACAEEANTVAKCVEASDDAYLVCYFYVSNGPDGEKYVRPMQTVPHSQYSQHEQYPSEHWTTTKRVTFPPSTGINVNMMPFLLHKPEASLPENLHPYIDMIKMCSSLYRYRKDTTDSVAYLTIHESDVAPGESQRRPGLHIESPVVQTSTARVCTKSDPEWRALSWGLGTTKYGWPVDGIFMASSVADSCVVYPALVKNPEKIADPLGGLPECTRKVLGTGHTLEAGELVWITDRTPHESLPLPHGGHRQFFRLVVGPIDVWYSKHNTRNPCGTEPDATVVDYDKFVNL